ncbi:MAG: hypothetical protein ACLUEQ_00910 [Cloacibacillus evryensis]
MTFVFLLILIVLLIGALSFSPRWRSDRSSSI